MDIRPEFKGKESLNVSISELAAGPLVSLGAVTLADKLLPSEEKGFRKFVAECIIEPHLQLFEKIGGHVFKAYDVHQQHDFSHLQKNDPDLPQKPYKELSKRERSYKIADILTKTSIGFAAEGSTALGSQMVLNKVLGTKVNPYANVAIDVGAHALTIGAFMTLLSPIAENVKDGVANILEKCGMKRDHAKDVSRTATYVTTPSFVAYLATMAFVNRGGGNGKGH
ncbi:MAG TPA: hypothetical protein VFT64_07390 [Rickettsiales bacterium]|nr:hypothetical protein [Rickettsiales bacterium]